VAEEVSGLTHSQRVARLQAEPFEGGHGMKTRPNPLPVQPEPQAPDDIAGSLPLTDDEMTDEEAFYEAQKVAFAALKARNQMRPRRKL
jgi:hypothetical protein